MGYQISKKIGRALTLAFVTSIPVYLLLALSASLLRLYAWGHMDEPLEMKDFFEPFFVAMGFFVGLIAAGLDFWFQNRSKSEQFDPGIEATCLRCDQDILSVTFPCVPRPFILYSIRVPRGWSFTSNGKNFLLINRQIKFREVADAPQELSFEVSSPARLLEDYCLPLYLFTSLRSRPVEAEVVLS